MRTAFCTALVFAILAPAASARILAAESVMPPGQSGYVSVAGVASGSGSPHLTDQIPLFTSFRYKPATFGQPGSLTSPRSGVRIVRDRYGVPAVTGSTDYNAWWGAGYAIADDRLFQLELFRRATSGRLAEILGSDYLDDDMIARRDYYTDAELDQMLARIPRELYRRTEAYRDGVNEYIRQVRLNPFKLPGEFAALADLPVRDWTLRDTARVGIYLARTVPQSDGVELDNARALRRIGSKAFRTLLPLRNKGRITTIPKSEGRFPSQPGRTHKQEVKAFKRSARFVRGLNLPSAGASAAAAGTRSASRVLPRHGGSYMWAMRAPGNRAYLFSGPQLGFSLPEMLVEIELHSPTQNVRGVTAAGVPLVAIGHNAHVAWGYTSGLGDVSDLYAEKLSSSERYRYKGTLRTMDCRNEKFSFRAAPTDLPGMLPDLVTGGKKVSGSHTERLCRTIHGPVQARAPGVAYARRYATWGRDLETIVGLSALQDVRNVHDVNRAMLQVSWNENVIAADDSGNIGYWHPGLHPVRSRRWDERLPFPGTGNAEWRRLLPRTRDPHVINPKQGYLVNWNNMPSYAWTNGDTEARERATGPFHRSRWLRLLVAKVERHPSYAASRAIVQASGTVAQQRPFARGRLRKARKKAGGNARKILNALLTWDGSYDRTNPAGTVDPGVAIWENFKAEAKSIALGKLLPRGVPLGAAASLSGRTGNSHMFDITLGESYGLQVLKPREYRKAARMTYSQLRKRFGTSDISRWREPRRMYKVDIQGAAARPELPFYDRGTWQQSVAVGP